MNMSRLPVHTVEFATPDRGELQQLHQQWHENEFQDDAEQSAPAASHRPGSHCPDESPVRCQRSERLVSAVAGERDKRSCKSGVLALGRRW